MLFLPLAILGTARAARRQLLRGASAHAMHTLEACSRPGQAVPRACAGLPKGVVSPARTSWNGRQGLLQPAWTGAGAAGEPSPQPSLAARSRPLRMVCSLMAPELANDALLTSILSKLTGGPVRGREPTLDPLGSFGQSASCSGPWGSRQLSVNISAYLVQPLDMQFKKLIGRGSYARVSGRGREDPLT